MCAKSIGPQCCVRNELAMLTNEKQKKNGENDSQFSALQIFIFITCTAAAAAAAAAWHSISIAIAIAVAVAIPRRSHIHTRTHSQAQSSDVSCRTPIKSSFPVSQESLAIYLLFYSFLFCFLFLFFAECLPRPQCQFYLRCC